MPIRTVLFALVCAVVVAGAAVWFSWSVGPHQELVVAIDSLVPDDELDAIDRNLSPWCWTGSCPTVTATSTLAGDPWGVEQQVNRSFRERDYRLSRDDLWLVGENDAHVVKVRFLAEPDGSTRMDWVASGS